MLCVIHVKHDSEDKQTGYWQFECSSCMRNKIATLRAKNERMMQDHIRLCTAVGLDADAHIDMLAEAAERLRAECERLKARGIERMQYRIAKLEAALRDARYLLENHASEKHVLERIAAVLKGDAE